MAATPATLFELLDLGAEAHPERLALICDEEEITFGALRDEAVRVSTGLAKAGLRPGDRVALLLGNRPEYVAALFGIARAGAVAVPVNTMLKGDEIFYILQHAGASGLITGANHHAALSGLMDSVPGLTAKWHLDGNPDGYETRESLFADDGPGPDAGAADNPACIIYTSGVTGKPKGAVLSHRNYVANARQIDEGIGIRNDDRAICVLPLFHVNAQLVSLVAPLYAGATVILQRGFSPREFINAVGRHGATLVSAVPTIFAILNLAEATADDIQSLRLCISGSAPLPDTVFERFEEKYGMRVHEGYGLSEATCACSLQMPGSPRKPGSVGHELPGVEMRVAGKDGGRVPRGQVGEILVRGENVMLGYHDDEAATRETIVEGWLHTGDVGYRDEEGDIWLVGRSKDMIIRGGENIYPSEVERALAGHADVREAAVFGVPDEIWGEEVVAFVVVRPGTSPDADELGTYCKERIADFKCPTRIEFWSALPRSPIGEVDKKRLREEYRNRTGI